MACIPRTVRRLPPLLCHFGFRAERGRAGWPIGEPGQAKQVVYNASCGMTLRQEGTQLRCRSSEFLCFGVVQFLDDDRRRATQLVECLDREPVWFRDAKIAS